MVFPYWALNHRPERKPVFALESASFRFDWLRNVTFDLVVTNSFRFVAVFSAGSGILLTAAMKAAESCLYANDSVTDPFVNPQTISSKLFWSMFRVNGTMCFSFLFFFLALFCVCNFLETRLSFYMYACKGVWHTENLSVSQYLFLSVCPSDYLPIGLAVFMTACLFTFLSVCLLVCLSRSNSWLLLSYRTQCYQRCQGQFVTNRLIANSVCYLWVKPLRRCTSHLSH